MTRWELKNWNLWPFRLEQFRDVQLENLLTFLINEIINSFPIYFELKEVREMDTFFLTFEPETNNCCY